MLLRFGVENHGSIASYQQLLMTVTSLRDDESGLLTVDHAEETVAVEATRKTLRVAPVASIYGANAAGKSTLLKAFDFFVGGILSSHTRVASSKGTPYQPFLLDDESRHAPSRYDVDIAIDGTRYHYGYTLDGKTVINEWLYSYPLGASRQVKSTLFVRETAGDSSTVEVAFGKALRGENRQISKLVRPNSLFLSVAAQNAHPQLTPLFDFFNNKITRRLDDRISIPAISEQLSTYFAADERRRTSAINFLKAADIGVSGINFSKVSLDEKTRELLSKFEEVINHHFAEESDGRKILLENQHEKVFAHLQHVGANQKSYPIDLDSESAGTLSLLRLIGPAFVRLNEGGVLVIDELNSTLHPLVSRELIRLFSVPETNPGKAQLLFTTHDTNLLSGQLLRRDQIWFAEKDFGGATCIYPLSDIKVRAGDDFERGYLNGRFGAIPFMGHDLSGLLASTTSSSDE